MYKGIVQKPWENENWDAVSRIVWREKRMNRALKKRIIQVKIQDSSKMSDSLRNHVKMNDFFMTLKV